MRVIDADDAIERLGAYLMEDAQIEWGGTASEDIEEWKELASDILEDAPSTEIIRCGECKYWKSTVQMPNGTEVKCLYGRKADDFCSYGERDSEKPNKSETPTDSERVGKYPYNCNWDE